MYSLSRHVILTLYNLDEQVTYKNGRQIIMFAMYMIKCQRALFALDTIV